MNEKFTFFASFAESLVQMGDEDRHALLDAIMYYGIYGIEPELTGIPAIVFPSIRPNIDVSVKSAEDGRRGGRPKKEIDEKPHLKTPLKNPPLEEGIKGGCETNRKEKKRKEKNNIMRTEDDAQELFEMLWELYPRKKGKGQVTKKAKAEMLKIGYDTYVDMIARFRADMEGKDEQYIPYGSTFFNSGYADYLPRSPSPPPKQEKPPDPNEGLDKYDDDDPEDKLRHPYEDGWRINDDGYWVQTGWQLRQKGNGG